MVIKTDVVNEELAQKPECEECGSTDFVSDAKRGETICGLCGLVVDERIIDQGPEWRTFADDNGQRIRTGAPASFRFHDKGLTTQVGYDRRDASGSKLSPSGMQRAYRLRKWQRRNTVGSSLERNLAAANNKLTIITSQMGLPPGVVEACAKLYRQAAAAKIPRGRSIEKTLIACLIITCREKRIPRTIRDFAKVTRITEKDLGKYFRLVKRVLELPSQSLQPEEYLMPYCTNLKVPPEIRGCATSLIAEMREAGALVGKDPKSIAVACLYVAGKLDETQLKALIAEQKATKEQGDTKAAKEIGRKVTDMKRILRQVTQTRLSNESGVSEVTIRNRYRDICETLDIKLHN